LGEKMSDEEVDELLKAVDTSSGEINYTGMFCCLFVYAGSAMRDIDCETDLVRTILAN